MRALEEPTRDNESTRRTHKAKWELLKHPQGKIGVSEEPTRESESFWRTHKAKSEFLNWVAVRIRLRSQMQSFWKYEATAKWDEGSCWRGHGLIVAGSCSLECLGVDWDTKESGGVCLAHVWLISVWFLWSSLLCGFVRRSFLDRACLGSVVACQDGRPDLECIWRLDLKGGNSWVCIDLGILGLDVGSFKVPDNC
jgi:hypothetical protein